MMHDELEPEKKGQEGSEDQRTQVEISDEAMDQIFIEVRRLIADIDNPFTLLGKMVAVLGRDKAIEEMGGDDEGESDSGTVNSNGQLTAMQNAQAGLLGALAAEQAVRKTEELEMGQQTQPEKQKGRKSVPPQGAPNTQPGAPQREIPEDAKGTTGESRVAESLSRPQAESAPQPSGTPQSLNSAPNAAAREMPAIIVDPNLISRASDGSSSSPTMDFMKRANSLELANLLSAFFGKERTIEILGSYVSRNWISDEVAKMIVDCVTLLEKGDLESSHRKVGELLVEDHQVALFLLDEFAKSLFNISLSLRFRELMAAMKAAFEIHFSTSGLDVGEGDDVGHDVKMS